MIEEIEALTEHDSEQKNPKMLQIYLAAPALGAADKAFNSSIAAALAPYANVFCPEKDGVQVSSFSLDGRLSNLAASRVYNCRVTALLRSDCVIAVLDGKLIDATVAFEVGYANANEIICIGLQTDGRRASACGNDPMLHRALEHIYSSVELLTQWVRTSGE